MGVPLRWEGPGSFPRMHRGVKRRVRILRGVVTAGTAGIIKGGGPLMVQQQPTGMDVMGGLHSRIP